MLAVSVGTVTIVFMTACTDCVNQTDIYRKAIQRMFAELYSVPAGAGHVA